MGLDHGLQRRLYVKNWDNYKPEQRYDVSVARNGQQLVDPAKITYVIEEVITWRKANEIHNWFVQNVQGGKDDCGNYDVDAEQLVELLSLINQVLEDNSKAAELLPTQEGFFFGGTDYDSYYFDDLRRTKEILSPILLLPKLTDDSAGSFEYWSSW